MTRHHTSDPDPVTYVDTDAYFAEHPEYKACRMEGHNWSRFMPAGESYVIEREGTRDETWAKWRECTDDPATGTAGCGTVVWKRWDRFGRELNPAADYAPDYLLRGERMPRRGELWEQDVARAQQAHRDGAAPTRGRRRNGGRRAG